MFTRHVSRLFVAFCISIFPLFLTAAVNGQQLSIDDQSLVECFVVTPGAFLIGTAEMYFANLETVEDCMWQCKHYQVNSGFHCASFMWYLNEGDCVLSATSRTQKPEMFALSQKHLVDYYENICPPAVPNSEAFTHKEVQETGATETAPINFFPFESVPNNAKKLLPVGKATTFAIFPSLTAATPQPPSANPPSSAAGSAPSQRPIDFVAAPSAPSAPPSSPLAPPSPPSRKTNAEEYYDTVG